MQNNINSKICQLMSWKELTVYNTLTREKEKFKSIVDWEVKIYSCWPTVYSDAHIWNLRSYIFPDILKWALEMIWYKVKHIINITDVWHLTDNENDWEDKMELSSQRKWESVWEISEKYTSKFISDLNKLNIRLPDNFTKATNYIEAQIEMVRWLEEKWYTYKTSDGIYFDTSKFKDYPNFAKLDIENLNEWERVDFWEKKNKTDFALWKFSPKNWSKRQMEWNSPWWIWFPGWHIECSAMIWKELWKQIDIHTGWTDHIPVHHTNEIAQATCFHWNIPVNYWLHWEFLVLDKNKRIGKSEWNSITLESLIEKWFDSISYRFLLLTAHYRSFLTFSEESLTQAQNSLQRLKNEIKIVNDLTSHNIENNNLSVKWIKYVELISKWLLDDLNTPIALAKLREMLKDKDINNNEKIKIIDYFDSIFRLNLLDFSSLEKTKESIPEEITKIAEERWNYKINKDFKKADEYRHKLESMWYKVEDYKDHYILSLIKK